MPYPVGIRAGRTLGLASIVLGAAVIGAALALAKFEARGGGRPARFAILSVVAVLLAAGGLTVGRSLVKRWPGFRRVAQVIEWIYVTGLAFYALSGIGIAAGIH